MKTKKLRLRRKFVDACNWWLPARLERHITGQPVLNRTSDNLVEWFQQGMRITPTESEKAYLIEKLGQLAAFVGLLEKAKVNEAVKTAREKWNRELSKEEIIYLLKHYNGTMTVVLSENDGASIKLEG
jgi:hypothetical protein